MRPSALPRRLWHAQLRLRVLGGVVIVMLLAIVALDIGAIATMRRYLLGQTDQNLQVTLAATRIRLLSLVPGYLPQFAIDGRAATVHAGGGANVTWAGESPSPPVRSLVGGKLVAGASLNQVDSTMDRVERIVGVGSVAVVLLIGLGVFLVLRRGLCPIESMAAQADRITAGDLTERVTPQSPRSEVGRLGAALNGMPARIETGVLEREGSQQQMRRFFADASHELRTAPGLAARQRRALPAGRADQPGPGGRGDTQDHARDQAHEPACRRHAAAGPPWPAPRTEPRACRRHRPVHACAERAHIADPARAWRVSVAGGLTTTGDEELLRRAVDNLLTSVLVHTPADTAAIITASGDPEEVTIEVRDDGPGVPPDKLPHVFERFYRGDVRTARAPGSGLGLAIAAEIAIAHGGTAAAAPVSPHGLRVTLTLPAREDHPNTPPPATHSLLASAACFSGSDFAAG